MQINNQQLLPASFFLLASINAYGLLHRLGEVVTFAFDAIALGIIAIAILTGKYNLKGFTKKSILTLLILYTISLFSALILHNQHVHHTIIASRSFLMLAAAFCINPKLFSIRFLENTIITISLIYALIYITQLLVYPIEIVPFGNIEGYDREMLRVRIEGASAVPLAGLILMNRTLSKWNIKELSLSLLMLILVYLLGFRTLTIGIVLAYTYLIIRCQKYTLKKLWYSIAILVIIVMAFQVKSVREFSKTSQSLTAQQLNNIRDNVRIKAFNFYFNDHNEGITTLFIGNGFPKIDSYYGKKLYPDGKIKQGQIFADIGILGLTFVFGIGFVSLYVFLLIRPILLRVNFDRLYLKAFAFYLLFSSITTAEMYRAGSVGIFCMYLTIIEHRNLELKH